MKIQTRVDRDTRPDTVERDSFTSKVDERGVGNISGLKTADRSQRVRTTSAPRVGGKGNKRKRKKKAKSSAEKKRLLFQRTIRLMKLRLMRKEPRNSQRKIPRSKKMIHREKPKRRRRNPYTQKIL